MDLKGFQNGVEGLSAWLEESTEPDASIIGGGSAPSKYTGMTPQQKKKAEQLTSLFENGTIDIQYDYAENLDDGRGITAGRAGFTTRDGDAYEVVRLYTAKKSDNGLKKYLETLKSLTEDESDSTKNLKGFEKAWKEAAKDELFRQVQDYVVEVMYYKPSQSYADRLGLKTAIARAFLFDTIIQHGDGDEKDSIGSLLKSTPKNDMDETSWLEAFINTRRKDLEHSYDKETRDEWAESVSRCDIFKQILESGNYDFDKPIKIKTKEYDVTIP